MKKYNGLAFYSKSLHFYYIWENGCQNHVHRDWIAQTENDHFVGYNIIHWNHIITRISYFSEKEKESN